MNDMGKTENEQIIYDSTSIEELIKKENNGEIIIPYFQRQFVWDTDQQKKLIASLLLGMPIGSLLFLEGEYSHYASRPICYTNWEKGSDRKDDDDCTFLLDGQQRLSTIKSVCYDLYSDDAVRTLGANNWEELWRALPRGRSKGGLNYRWYINLGKREGENGIDFGLKNLQFSRDEIDENVEIEDLENIINFNTVLRTGKHEYMPGIPETDFQRLAIQKKHIPLWLLGSTEGRDSLNNILQAIARESLAEPQEQGQEDIEKKISLWAREVEDFLRKQLIQKAKLPFIKVSANNIAKGISIFEQVNSTGTKLSIYDLIVARMARADKKSLTDYIRDELQEDNVDKKIKEGKKWNPKKNVGLWDDQSLSSAFEKIFLNCLAIECKLESRDKPKPSELKVDCTKRKAKLNLTPEEIRDNWKNTIKHLLKVIQFLHFRCGIIDIKNLKYELMALPLYVVFRESITDEIIKRCEYWYWLAIFSGRYQFDQNPRSIDDINSLYNWCIEGTGKNPFEEWQEKDFFFEKRDYSDKDTLKRMRGRSSERKLDELIYQYLISNGDLLDLHEKDNKEPRKLTPWDVSPRDLEKHHIFIIAERTDLKTNENDDTPDMINSILNMTYISKKTNQAIKRASKYKEINCGWENHCLPNDFDKRAMAYANEKDPEKQEEMLGSFLDKRFEILKETVEQELKDLLS